ncbi:MAG TPA: phospho-sugar mutase, partial [Gemmataceae bacterium]|nr:phospho-sugar mutase [Gemmataceae bacterium]
FRNEVVTVAMSGILGRQNMARMLDQMRSTPPREIGGLAVTATEDLRDEHGRLGPFKGATDRAARNFLLFTLGDRARIALRPSGTEPKAKAYIEVHSAPRPFGMAEQEWQASCRAVDEQIRQVAVDFLRQALGLVGLEMPKEGVRLSR